MLWYSLLEQMKLLSSSVLLVCYANAFTTFPHHNKRSSTPSLTRLNASDGPPQYDKFQATLRQAEKVGEGSVMLHIDTQDVVEYEPGHVLALEMQVDDNDNTLDKDSKTYKDANANNGWMRGPYTVSRSTNNSIDILIKVVGEKSKRFSEAESGTPIRFGGKFHVPILEGIDVDTTKRVVMISTGVGIGPVVGAIEKALVEHKVQTTSFPPIDLISCYRNENEVVYKDYLDNLQTDYPDKFSWKAVISSAQGRLSANDENLKALLTETSFSADIGSTHYHLIGNGSMVSEFKAAFKKAGVPDDKVTLETYFNHQAKVNEEVVDRIAFAVMETTAAAV